MDNKVERRLFERVDGVILVRYNVEGSDKEYYTTAENIGGGGIKILLYENLAPGTILELEIFKHRSEISAKGKGKITWIYAGFPKKRGQQIFEAGIEFINLNFLYIGSVINDLEVRSKTAEIY